MIIKAALFGVLLGVLFWMGFQEAKSAKCDRAYVIIQSFDVCNTQLPGCFFTAEDVLKVGQAVRYRKTHECKEI